MKLTVTRDPDPTFVASDVDVAVVNYSRQYAQSGNYQYAGMAPVGSALGASVWNIYRITYAAGKFVSSARAINGSWNNRVGLAYT